MNQKKQLLKYLISDFLSAGVSWTLFFMFRKVIIETKKFGYPVPIEFDHSYFQGLIILPVAWVLFYFISGYHKEIYRKSRLSELGQTIATTFIGVMVIFF
ncbi:MAG: hypothetical protein PHY99_09150, partial [Bacteroidales bacterium]|nr:hypothetical protein [Bacteroidales bacterium]